MNVTSSTQTQYPQTTNKAHRAEQNPDTEYKQNEASVTQNTDTQSNQNKSPSVIKDFLNDLYSSESTSFKSSVIKGEIENKVNKYAQLMMDERGTTSDSELQTSKLLNEYKKELLNEYKTSIESSTDTVMSAEQEAIIKVLMKENTQETSSLEALLATKTGTNATQETKATGRMAEMEEKYKDVYTPIPETYTKGSEELQQAKIKEAYPNYISITDIWKLAAEIYTEEFGEKPSQLGQETTQEQRDKQEASFTKAFDMYGGQEAVLAMDKGVYEIKKAYPINTWGKDERNTNAKELAHFHNAVVYEELENGKTIDEARKHAGLLTTSSSFIKSGYRENDFIDMLEKAGRADPDAKQDYDNRVDFNAPNNSVWDLREYGIEGRWQENNIYENDEAMISEIEKKIGQFSFMLNNEDLIKEANSKLNPHYQTLGQANHYKEYITDQYLPEAEFALDIFKKYKIYDS